MTRDQLVKVLRPVGGYGLLFVLGCIRGGATVGLVFSMSFVAAHLNEFFLVRAILKATKGVKPTILELVAGTCGVVASVALVCSGFGLILGLATILFVTLDAVLLRFR